MRIQLASGIRKIIPPVYFLAYLLAAFALHRAWPVAWLLPVPVRLWGALPALAGCYLTARGASLFNAKGTPVKPFEPSTILVLEGPYRWTRNPMYLGLVMISAGMAILLGSAVAWFAPAALFVTLQRFFIPQEEQLLEQSFGEKYRAYKQRVRRWI